MYLRYSLIISAAFLTACNQSETMLDTDSYTVFENGHILTMNQEQPGAASMTIKDNKIINIGPSKNRTTSDNVTVIDLKGKTVMPGIIDSHVHVRELGMDAVKANLVGVQSAEDMAERLKAHYPNPKKGQWLIGQGWDEGVFGTIGYPDRAVLDAAFRDNPVKLESLHGFAGFYNGAALDIAGITTQTLDPEVGNILRRENGEPSGVLLTLAQSLVNKHVPETSQEQLENAIMAGLSLMGEAGVTSVHEAGMTPQDVKAFQSLAEKGALPIRVYGMLDGNNKPLMESWFSNGPLDDPEDFFDVRSIKVFYDGSLGSRTAMMKAPYSDKPEEAKPTARIHLDEIDKLAEQAADKGFQMAVHAIGDEGNDCVIASYELRLSQKPDLDHRWRIEHAQVVLPDFYKRQSQLGVIASMQSSHAVGDSKWAEDRVGAERIQHAYAWQTILKTGGRLMMNSDLPGEPWRPMETLYFAVNRKALDAPRDKKGWYMDQALSTPEALKAMTIENAYGAFQDDKLGSLEPGKWADFIILDKNPLETAPYALKDIKVLETWVAGKKLN